MKLKKEEARDIVWGDHEDWETIATEITDTGRWSIQKRGVFRHIPTGKYYQLWWSVGATEYQDEKPFEYTDPEPVEVHEVERVIKVWKPVQNKES